MKSESRRFPLELGLLCVAAFLAPLIGGHVSVSARSIDLGLVGEIFGGGALPYLSRLILGLPILAGFAILAAQNRILQLPNIRLMAWLTALIGLLGLGVLGGRFFYSGIAEWLTWFIYGGSLFLTVAAAGRVRGVHAILAALSAGITLVALKGIAEYVAIMGTEPSHRIFAGWTNPNAVASVLVAGALLMSGLAAALDRRSAIFAGFGSLTCTIALVLTQSKGAFLAALVGGVILVGCAAIGRVGVRRLAVAILPLALGLICAVGLGRVAVSSAEQTGPAFARLAAATSTSEQSVGFRQNLWRSAIQIANRHPMGVGPGGFKHYSTEPGLTESTVFAHQAFLQIAVEGGWLALLAFAGLSVVWLRYAFKGLAVQPPSRRMLRAGITAAAIGLAAHGMTESNLSYVGSGIVLFILVGLSLQLSTDGSSPEALPQSIRLSVVGVCCILPLFGIAIVAAAEAQKASLMNALTSGDPSKVEQAVTSLENGSYGDPEAAYLAALYGSRTEQERAERLLKVAERLPTPRVLRAAVRSLVESGQPEKALAVNRQVFEIDPHNLKALSLQLEIQKAIGDTSAAIQTAQRLIAIENEPSFQVRAIPEMVPTESYEARLFLAEHITDPAEKAKLLFEAITGLHNYFITSAPLVKKMADAGLESYAGESMQDAKRKLLLARQAVQDYRRTVDSAPRAESDSESLATVTEMSKDFEGDFAESFLR